MASSITMHQRRGFSLIELVIVVVIIGIIGAIAIPRLSRGADGASDSALAGDLAVLRNAIDLYATEHNGTYPTLAEIDDQLTQYTDISGNTNTTKTSTYLYGPYIRKIPALKVGADAGKSTFIGTYTAGYGWVYEESTGVVYANTAATEVDAASKKYSEY